MEIDHDGRQKKMDKILRELMEDDIGKKLKKKAMDWKRKKNLVEDSTGPRGSSSLNFLNFLNELFYFYYQKAVYFRQRNLMWVVTIAP